MKALLLALLLAADEPEPPRYPLGPLPARDLTEPGRPFLLTDLAYRATLESEIEQSFSARVRFKSAGFLDAFVDGQRRGGGVQTQRLSLRYFEDPSFTNLQAGWRGRRVLLDASAERRPPQDGSGWTVAGEAAVRLSPDLEAFVSVLGDTRRGQPAPSRPLAEQRAALLWQRGARLDLSAAFAHGERRADTGAEIDTLGGSAAAELMAWNSEASLEAGFERTRGFLPHEEAFADAFLGHVVGGRLLAEGRSLNRWEPGVKWFEHELGLALGLHARRVRLARAGDAARRGLALQRRALDLGYNERRVYAEGERRSLRERLALSPRRAELREELRGLHHAEIDERRVELLRAAFSERVESVTGTRRRRVELAAGLPWPLRPPWRADESATPFLLARYARDETRYGNGFSSLTHEAALQAELNREMALVVRWRRPGLTPLDVSLIRGRERVWEVEYVYALGR
jgi:hypothetical protein